MIAIERHPDGRATASCEKCGATTGRVPDWRVNRFRCDHRCKPTPSKETE